MKIYQIAGKQYAVSGDNLFEKVPEFDSFEALVDNGTIVATAHIVPPLPLRKKTKPKKQDRKQVPKEGYKKGTCGKCGEEGHSAWHCPERKRKAPHKSLVKKKGARSGCGTCGKVGHNRKTCPENNPEKNVEQAPAIETRTDEELAAAVHGLQQDGLDSLVIASKLKIRISKVNELWDPSIASSSGKAEEEEEGEIL